MKVYHIPDFGELTLQRSISKLFLQNAKKISGIHLIIGPIPHKNPP